MKIRLITFMMLLSGSIFASDAKLKPFASDGCSAFPDGSQEQRQLWLQCCTEHDYAYWKGGTYKEREAADFALKACVEKVGEEEIALLMLAGVRVGGTPFLPTKFRWGYGWPYPRFYGELTKGELLQVENAEEQGNGKP
ncbi:hypothetical protein HBA55_36520 [Pseudomaricurvus alkylphenolicus]|nr:hypothetical protein [Pseudomaricurvus alkylphenolicus]